MALWIHRAAIEHVACTARPRRLKECAVGTHLTGIGRSLMVIERATTTALTIGHRVQIGADVTGNPSGTGAPAACGESET